MPVLWIKIYVHCVMKTVLENIIYVDLLTLYINANYCGVEHNSVQKNMRSDLLVGEIANCVQNLESLSPIMWAR